MEDLDYSFGLASGRSKEACFALAYRSPAGEGFRPERGDSWVVEYEGEFFNTHMNKGGWLTALWRSDQGSVYVTDADGFVYRGPQAAGQSWPSERLEGVLTGVWGLDEQHVYAWGELSGSRPVLYRYDGARWAPMATPARPIVALHGLAPDLLFAVGDAGMIARWDGSTWIEMTSPDQASLSAVFAVSADEVYAGGHGRSLHLGSVYGWTPITVHPGPITSVVKWGGAVWVATLGDAGLCKLNGSVLESIKPNLQVLRLEGRERLLYTTTGKIGDTADGGAFASYPVEDFIDATEDVDPLWD